MCHAPLRMKAFAGTTDESVVALVVAAELVDVVGDNVAFPPLVAFEDATEVILLLLLLPICPFVEATGRINPAIYPEAVNVSTPVAFTWPSAKVEELAPATVVFLLLLARPVVHVVIFLVPVAFCA